MRAWFTAGYNPAEERDSRVSVAKVLIVDDEPNIREVVGLYLRRDGHDIVSAADGEEGQGKRTGDEYKRCASGAECAFHPPNL